MKIVIQNPDASIREVLKDMFGLAGWDVIVAETLREAVSLTQSFHPDIALIEPWEERSLFQARNSMNPLWEYGAKVVFGTTFASTELVTAAKELRPHDVVSLPLPSLPDLPSHLQALIRQEKSA